MNGNWTFKNGLAVFTNCDGEKVFYQREALIRAISNVKGEREFYKTEEAYLKMIAHFERGLALFPIEK